MAAFMCCLWLDVGPCYKSDIAKCPERRANDTMEMLCTDTRIKLKDDKKRMQIKVGNFLLLRQVTWMCEVIKRNKFCVMSFLFNCFYDHPPKISSPFPKPIPNDLFSQKFFYQSSIPERCQLASWPTFSTFDYIFESFHLLHFKTKGTSMKWKEERQHERRKCFSGNWNMRRGVYMRDHFKWIQRVSQLLSHNNDHQLRLIVAFRS